VHLQLPERIVVGHGIGPTFDLDRSLECRPRVGYRALGEIGVELGQRSGVTK
jgi:hypothetical protein